MNIPNRLAAMETLVPNVRKAFLPDIGYVLYDADLKGADAQVVAWEAEDEDLKAAFRSGMDVHAKNAEDMLGSAFTNLPAGSHSRDAKRQENKVAVHATNYGVTARGLAQSQGWLVAEAERFQRRWFDLHPRIKTHFHGRVMKALEKTRTVYNAFGFRKVYFDRIEACFGQALAWIPQSTVALNSYYGFFQLEERHPIVEPLLQNHDSNVFQVPKTSPLTPMDIKSGLAVITPYQDPLIIPWDLKRSEKSWGDLEKCK